MLEDIVCLMRTVHPDVLVISETWLDSSVVDSELCIPGYLLFCADCSWCGGGVTLYCVDHLSCSIFFCGNTVSGVEVLWASIACHSLSSPLTLGCFYRLPSLPTESVSELCDSIELKMTTKKYVIACGDFNIDMVDLSKPYSKLLHDFLTSHSLQQPINAPTRFSASSQSILDLFILSSDIPISESHVLDLPISHHLPNLLDIHCKVPKPPPRCLVTRRSFKYFFQI